MSFEQVSVANFFDKLFLQIYDTQAGVIRGTNMNTNTVQELQQSKSSRVFRQLFENTSLPGNYVNLGLVTKVMDLGQIDEHGILFWDNIGENNYKVYVDPSILKVCGMDGEIELISSDIGVYLTMTNANVQQPVSFVISYQVDDKKSAYSYYIPKNV